jgi:hypothetical protein
MHLDEEEREKWSAVVWMQAAYALLDTRWRRMDQVPWGDDKQACIEEVVPEVLTSTSNQEQQTIIKVVALSKELAMVDHIESTTPITPKALQVLPKNVPAFDSRKYEFHGINQLDYTILAYQEKLAWPIDSSTTTKG